MAKVLAFTNQKGGVGKTTSAVNVALSLAVSEVRTLLIDLDPQSNATTGLAELFDEVNGNIYDVMLKGDGIKVGSLPRPLNKKYSISTKKTIGRIDFFEVISRFS